MGKIIYFKPKINKTDTGIEDIEKLYKNLRNSTIQVIETTGKVPKIDISMLSEKEKEMFFYKAKNILKKDKEYIKILLEMK